MYSRYHPRTDAPLRLPEHYSGTAFSDTAQETQAPRRIEPAKPSPPPTPPPLPAQRLPKEEHGEYKEQPLPRHPHSLPSMGQEELLLLGLITLLADCEGNSDTLFSLLLLLFLG